MKKVSLLSIFIFLILDSIFAVTYDNLYVVGNACSAGWNPDGALVMVQESENTFTWSGPLKKDNGNQERFKLLTARSWTTSLTCNLEKAGHQIITSGGEYDLYIKLETDGKPDNAFQVAETGIYTIEVNTSSMKMKCTKIADYEDPNLVFTKETFHSTSEGSLNYRKLEPPTIEKGKQYPLVIFLHGAGERGSDNESQLRYGSEMFANPQNRKDYPAFVLFPQCPLSNFWPFESQPASYDATTFPIDYPTSTPIKLVKELIDSYLQMEEIDKDRIYILGISMGGMGTFDIACRYPETFAAAIPICGGVNVERLDNKVKNIYWRLFHGDADGVVPVNNSRQAYQKLTNIKADAEYIEVPGASHFVWDEVFKREDFLSWIFAKKRQSTGGSDIETSKTDTSLRCYCYKQMLYIDTNDQTPLKANVYTTSGSLVHSSCYNSSSIVSPLTSLKPGIYIIEILQGEKRYHSKISL